MKNTDSIEEPDRLKSDLLSKAKIMAPQLNKHADIGHTPLMGQTSLSWSLLFYLSFAIVMIMIMVLIMIIIFGIDIAVDVAIVITSVTVIVVVMLMLILMVFTLNMSYC